MDARLEDIVRLTEKAIRFRSTADRPDERKACLDLYLEHLDGAPVEVDRREYDGNPMAVIKPAGVERPKVILCGHLDVVPGDERQFEARLDGDRLLGRGAMDMKGSLSALVEIVRVTAGEGIPWWLVIVSDEEVGGNEGAGRLAEEGLEGDLFLAAEPSRMSFSLQSKGALRLAVKHRGLSAHGSAPWNGVNSVEKIMGALPRIREIIPEVKEESWVTTASLTLIRGGTVINQVPDECRVSMDIRYVPDDDPDKITGDLREALPGFEVEVLNVYPPMVCREDAPLLVTLKEVFRKVSGDEPTIGRQHGATDARYFSPYMDALVFGPEGEGLHGPEEWVSLESMETFRRIIQEWGEKLKES